MRVTTTSDFFVRRVWAGGVFSPSLPLSPGGPLWLWFGSPKP
jgi:hypothetical protein